VDLNARETAHTYAPNNPVLPMSSLYDTSEMLEPSKNLPDQLLRHRELFKAPTLLNNADHHDEGKACHCAPTAFGYHQTVGLNDVCLKQDHCASSDAVIPFDFSLDKMTPNCRPHNWSLKAKAYTLSVPTPFFLPWIWKARPYLAVHSKTSPLNPVLEIFYRLYSADRFKQHRQPYLVTPDQWTPETHPMFAEPDQDDELYSWSKELYGSETLLRTLPARHPARDHRIRIYSATDLDYTVPVIAGGQPAAIENFLKCHLRPFYKEGLGEVLCAVCILADKQSPSLHTRSGYVVHFQEKHHRNIGTLGLAFSTGYGSRIYEAFVLYSLCFAYYSDCEDQPKAHPFAGVSTCIGPDVMETDDTIATLMQARSQAAGPRRPDRPRYEPSGLELLVESLDAAASQAAAAAAADLAAPSYAEVAAAVASIPPAAPLTASPKQVEAQPPAEERKKPQRSHKELKDYPSGNSPATQSRKAKK
jgi:hypothetical protein